MKRLIILAICMIGILLVSGCTSGPNYPKYSKFCVNHGYIGFDFLEMDGWFYGWCFNAEGEVIIERRCITEDQDTDDIYFDDEICWWLEKEASK